MNDAPLLTFGLRVRVTNPKRPDAGRIYRIVTLQPDGYYRLIRPSGKGYMVEAAAPRNELEIVIPQIPTPEEIAQTRKETA